MKNIEVKKESNNLVIIWKNNLINIVLTLLTIVLASFILLFNNTLTKNRRFFLYLRVSFLSWTLIWLGWLIGGQLSIIHLVNFLEAIISFSNNFNSFLVEPVILLIGFFTLISLFIWGRALFCGWLCPFGAFQELLSITAKRLGIKQLFLSQKIDVRLKYIKYILLFVIIVGTLLELKIINYFYNIEPFKTAITLRFFAPANLIIWATFLLVINLFVERAYCRYLCPLGGGLALMGKVRL